MKHRIFFHWANFLKKAILSWEVAKNRFGGTWPFFRRTGRPTSKVNITFLMGNKILNIFIQSLFFLKKKPYFLRKWRKLVFFFWVFWGEGFPGQKWMELFFVANNALNIFSLSCILQRSIFQKKLFFVWQAWTL